MKFAQVSNWCKRIIEASKLAYANKRLGEVLSSTSHKEKLFAEKFSKNLNLDDSGISLSSFASRTNLHNIPNCIIFL